MLDSFRRNEGADQLDLFDTEEARQERIANRHFIFGIIALCGLAYVLFGVL